MTDHLETNPAAGVILLREAKESFEVFMNYDAAAAKQLDPMELFPGGPVNKEDYSKPMISRCRGLFPDDARRILDARLSPELSLGHWVTAIRILFEASGILLCVTDEHKLFNATRSDVALRLSAKRKAVIERSLTFQAFLEAEGLICDASRLAYFSRWLVRENSSNPLDARFYLALLGQDQPICAASHGLTHGVWLTPDHALSLHQRGELPLPFPVFASLRTLADFSSLDALGREYRLTRGLAKSS